jgi:hypothetical protein
MKKTLLLLNAFLAFNFYSTAQLITNPDPTPNFTFEFPDLINNDFGNLNDLGNWSTRVIIKRESAGTEETLQTVGYFLDTLPFGAGVIDDSTKYGNFSVNFVITPDIIEFSETDLEKEISIMLTFGNSFATGEFTYEKILTRYIRQLGRKATYSEGIPYTSSIEGNYQFRLSYFIDSSLEFNSDPVKFSYAKPSLSVANLNKEINLFPNPTNDYLTLPENYNWTVLNSTGQIVLNGTGNSINLESQPTGIYFVKMENNEITKIARVIKQ